MKIVLRIMMILSVGVAFAQANPTAKVMPEHAILFNALEVQHKIKDGHQHVVLGEVVFQLKSGDFNLIPGEWAPAEHALTVTGGKIYVHQHAGHWQTLSLPPTCLQKVALGQLLEVHGVIKVGGVLQNLACVVGVQKDHMPPKQARLNRVLLPELVRKDLLPRWQQNYAMDFSTVGGRHARTV